MTNQMKSRPLVPNRLRSASTFSLFFLMAVGGLIVPLSADTDAVALCRSEAQAGQLDNCRIALAANPGDISIRRLIAHGLLVVGDEAGSLGEFEALANEFPDDARAQYDYGVTLVALHHYAHGADILVRAVTLDPEFLDAQIAASIILAQVGRQEEAFTALSKAAALGSDTAMYELSESYRIGYGVKMDEAAAFLWLTRAAEAGHVAAMDKLVEIYLEGGYGIEPSDTRAEAWAMRAHRRREGLD